MTTDLNDGGRGLNFVVIDPVTRVVAHVSRFDTFATGKQLLLIFLVSNNLFVKYKNFIFGK